VLRKIDFLYKMCKIDSLVVSHVESNYINTDMCKFESSQKHESRTQSADSSKACRKPRASNCRQPLH